MRARQSGLATVEFAVAGIAALMVLFGCIEIGRMLFVWNTVGEATRRAARLAALCPLDDPAIARAALISSGEGGSSRYLHGLKASHVKVTYLNEGGGATGVFAEVRYATVEISGYRHSLLIPFVTQAIDVPAFRTTVPVESLGLIPESGARVCIEG